MISKDINDKQNQSLIEATSATGQTARAVVNPDGTNIGSALSTGAATSANQQPPVTTPTIYNITLTLANTEYTQALPANTREFRFICRTLYDVRFAWVTGKVATPIAPYLTLPAGADYYSDNDNLASQTLYLASSTAGVIVELECWTA